MRKLEIFDTTLRDGVQAEGVSFTVSDKLKIVQALDAFGVDYIEAGNPGSNPKDMEFFRSVAELKLKNAKLVAFGSTKRKNVAVSEDANVKSLLDANTDVVAIFGKAWDLHATEIIGTTLEENLNCITETVKFFKSEGKEVIFDAEHFFDGYNNNADYAMQALQAACDGGADVLVLCDTNGGMLPLDMHKIVKTVSDKYPDTRIGIHCHNDSGCATANTIVAVDSGVCHIQGTFTGIGERCGNADLSIIIPNLQLKSGYDCVDCKLDKLYETEVAISEIANMSIPNNKPYVGDSAFAHKGGMHIDGVDKLSASFEHIDPALVGNRRKFLLSEVSGKKAVLLKLKKIAPELTKDSPETIEILRRLKELEHGGYQFETADASFELMAKKVMGTFKQHFELSMYRANSENPFTNGDLSSNAVIKIKVGDTDEITAADGNGPVHALDQALRKALTVFYPILSGVYLIDYKVRVLETGRATDSYVRVLIESTDGKRSWTTVGVSADIIEASFTALVDSLEYKLNMDEK